MEVTLEEAYAEACRALGESIVRERLLSRGIQNATATHNGGSSGNVPNDGGVSPDNGTITND